VYDGSLVQGQLLLPRYDTYSDVQLDLINSVGIALNPIFPSTPDGSASGFSYTYTRLSGGGRTAPSNESFLYSSIQPGIAPALPDTWSNLGHFTQNGERVLTATLEITTRDGSAFPVATWFDTSSGNLNDTTAFGLFFSNSSDTYLQCGAKPSDLSGTWQGFSVMSSLCSTGALGAPASYYGLGGVWGSVNVGGTSNQTLTITITQRCPIVLVPSPLLFLRTNLVSQTYASNNFNEQNNTPDPSDLESSNILATIPIQNDVLFFQESNNAHPTFFLDTKARNIASMELFLTDRHGNTEFRLFPLHSITSFTTNLSFSCLLRIQVIANAVIERPLSVATYENQAPARLASQPLTQVTKNSYYDNPTTRLARR
jgi:hypothetical protein